MEFTEEIMALFERYLAGGLTEEECLAFEARMEKEPDFAREFADFLVIHQACKELAASKRGKEYRALYNSNKRTPVKKIRPWYYGVAAAVLLLFVLGISWLLLPSSHSPAALYSEYAMHEKLRFSTMSDEGQALAQAETLFNNKEYKAALPLLEKHLSQRPNDLDAQLAKGICALETEQYPLAIRTFEAIANSDARINKGNWYLGLTYLKLEDRQNARRVLQQLLEEDGYNAQKAGELLLKLEE